MGKGEDHFSGSLHQGAIIGLQAFLSTKDSTYPVTPPVPGIRLRNRGNGKSPFQRSQARTIFGVIIFCSRLSLVARVFVFLLHDIPWASGYYGSQAASGGYGRIRKGKGTGHGVN